jgi:hypothetical protein
MVTSPAPWKVSATAFRFRGPLAMSGPAGWAPCCAASEPDAEGDPDVDPAADAEPVPVEPVPVDPVPVEPEPAELVGDPDPAEHPASGAASGTAKPVPRAASRVRRVGGLAVTNPTVELRTGMISGQG